MNEQANKILADLLQKASDGIDAAVSFSHAQIPDVVHQLLLWNAVSSIIWQFLALVISLVISTWIYKGLKQRGERVESGGWRGCSYVGKSIFYDNDGDLSGVGFLACMSGGFMLICCLVTFIGNFDWLKIWLAPKLYLIEYAARLVK